MQIRLINSQQTINTLVLSTISAIACGLIQSEWTIWIPGTVFGILFAIANFRRKIHVVAYIAVSSVIYIGAVGIFFKLSDSDLNNYLAGGLLAGAFGALALSLITKLVSKTHFDILDEFRSTMIGGITGIAFVQIFVSNVASAGFSNNVYGNWVLNFAAFAIWQVPVGWLLTTSIQSNSSVVDELSTNTPV